MASYDVIVSDILIFANPIAGRGRGGSIAQRLERRFAQQGIRTRTFLSPPYMIADAELRADAPARAMITIGGDGTLRSAVERMLGFCGNDPSSVPPVLTIPLGTANLMARHLRLKWNERTLEDDVAAAVAARRTVMLDAARANGQVFLLMAGVGIDAMVVHELDRMRSGPIDLTSYALPAFTAMRKYDYPPLRVEIDGRVVLDNEPAMAFVGNTREYGTGFPILTEASSNDGMLDVCVLPCNSILQAMRLLLAAVTGDHVNEEGVIYQKARSVRIDSPAAVPVQIDGEAAGHTPLNIELLPTRLALIVP